MNDIVEVRAVVRMEMLDRVVHCLRESGVPRLSVTKLHVIGAGVDPRRARVAPEEDAEEMDKALVQFICDAARAARYVELVARSARTGRRGDGIVSVHPVLRVAKIRTGVEGLAALA